MAIVCERILANIHTQAVSCLGFSHQKRQMIFGFKDGELMAFEPEKGNITHFKHIHRGAISAIQYWPRGKLVLISSIDGVITAWSAELILKEEYQLRNPEEKRRVPPPTFQKAHTIEPDDVDRVRSRMLSSARLHVRRARSGLDRERLLSAKSWRFTLGSIRSKIGASLGKENAHDGEGTGDMTGGNEKTSDQEPTGYSSDEIENGDSPESSLSDNEQQQENTVEPSKRVGSAKRPTSGRKSISQHRGKCVGEEDNAAASDQHLGSEYARIAFRTSISGRGKAPSTKARTSQAKRSVGLFGEARPVEDESANVIQSTVQLPMPIYAMALESTHNRLLLGVNPGVMVFALDESKISTAVYTGKSHIIGEFLQWVRHPYGHSDIVRCLYVHELKLITGGYDKRLCFYEISAYAGAKPLRLTLENAHTHDAGICALTVATTRENHSWCVHKVFKIQ